MTSECLRQLSLEAIRAVYPTSLVRQFVNLCRANDVDDSNFVLSIGDKIFRINSNTGCHVVGFGKAVLGMAAELTRVLGTLIKSGVLSVPLGIQLSLEASGQTDQIVPADSPFTVIEGARDNLPDEPSMEAARQILNLASKLTKKDILIVLVSGGGSALLPAPSAPLTLADKLAVIKTLSQSGATIQELNTVRISLSDLKGGKLAQLASPATVIGLILSDIIDDPIDLISSGPTVTRENVNLIETSKSILTKYQIENEKVFRVLNDKMEGKNNGPKVHNFLIGNNTIALKAAQDAAQKKGFTAIILSNRISGEAKTIGSTFAKIGIRIAANEGLDEDQLRELGVEQFELKKLLQEINKATTKLHENGLPVILLGGGETIVNVTGPGKGGRNQEMVLSAMINSATEDWKFYERFTATFLSIGTDGIDGPTDAAGAVANLTASVNLSTLAEMKRALEENDSYNFLSSENLIKTGHTGTNVMDLHLLAVSSK